MTTIALFSGQGSQYEKMGLDLVKQDAELESIYEAASEALGFDLFAIVADADAQTLGRTIYAQPAIMATSLICLEAAKKRGFTYDAVAGHSLGEYAAMVAAGMLSLEDGFKVIKARSEAMDAAAAAADGAMCAVLKLAPAEVERICAETEGYVVPANYNSAVQTVIAADAFYEAVRDVKFAAPKVPFYSNVLGGVRTDFSDMPKALAEHIVSPVRFTDELAAMQAAGITRYIEFGPKNVLTGLVKKTLKGVTAKNCENCETLEGVLE